MSAAVLVPFLNDREEAVAFWLVLGLAWSLTRSQVRGAVAQVFKAFVVSKVSGLFLLAGGYTAGVIWLLWREGFWDSSMLKESIYWFGGIAFVTLLNLSGKDERFLKTTLLDTIKVTAAVEFLVNLYVFPIYIEIFLVPLIFFAFATFLFSQSNPEYAPVHKALGVFLTVVGLVLIAITAGRAIANFDGFATAATLRDFLLPPVLTAAFVPFLYAIAVLMAYELVFMRVEFALRSEDGERKVPLSLRWLVVWTCGFNLSQINRFSPEVMPELHVPESGEERRRAIREWGSRRSKPV